MLHQINKVWTYREPDFTDTLVDRMLFGQINGVLVMLGAKKQEGNLDP